VAQQFNLVTHSVFEFSVSRCMCVCLRHWI